MIFAELLFALAIALFFTVVFTVLGRRARRWPSVMVFFLLIFLAAWAGGVWITPVGDTFLGIYWISFFVAGLIFALFLETATAFSSRRSQARDDEIRREENLEITISMFFWILLLALIVAIIIGYVHLR
ncbi:MAG: hypothetical protein E3J56_07545 [Candidatus Aminicenantes bacterium]|nr:MAG: hypothetical protein E3J56_07545 [Candidatus Aminicenantes bacterium]